uniref:Morc S5 domain-containing protein n=1 Tax=Amphiprion percula TaxID=161767 RepID=A0A3P8STP5_AMPPE
MITVNSTMKVVLGCISAYFLSLPFSFGFTEKGSGKASLQAIGVYGNGFKSGSMRLGRDALIFTKNGGCQTVGMLSQTYLENIKAQAVIVPIVPFNQLTKSLVVTEDSEASLAAILQHSIVSSLEQIQKHFDSILSKKGTKILIWNIRRAKDGKTEIDFETDPSDFRLPEIQIEELKKGPRNSGSLRPEHNIPDMHYSLRAYLSILYLKPRTQVILRGRKILTKLVSKRLIHIEHDVYKPHFSVSLRCLCITYIYMQRGSGKLVAFGNEPSSATFTEI